MMTQDEFMAADDTKAAAQQAMKEALLSIASGAAPTLKLRTLALRTLQGIDTAGLALSKVHPTPLELAELQRLEDAAELAARRR